MGVLPQDVAEEGAASRQYHLVGLHLAVITSQGNIEEVLFFSQFSESDTNVRFKVVPPKAELL